MKKIHQFRNGIKVYDEQLIDVQRNRYKKCNVHEAEEEKVFVKLISNIKENGCFVNIGAGVGYYALLAKRIRQDLIIHAYEPLKTHRIFFIENIKLNKYKNDEFIIHSEGVYTKNELVLFKKNRYGSAIDKSNISPPNKMISSFFEKGSRILIKTITLADLLIQVNMDIDLLQMDIQGLEAELLDSAREVLIYNKIKSTLIGTHSNLIHTECLQILMECNLRIIYEEANTTEQPDGIIAASLFL